MRGKDKNEACVTKIQIQDVEYESFNSGNFVSDAEVFKDAFACGVRSGNMNMESARAPVRKKSKKIEEWEWMTKTCQCDTNLQI